MCSASEPYLWHGGKLNSRGIWTQCNSDPSRNECFHFVNQLSPLLWTFEYSMVAFSCKIGLLIWVPLCHSWRNYYNIVLSTNSLLFFKHTVCWREFFGTIWVQESNWFFISISVLNCHNPNTKISWKVGGQRGGRQ